MELVQGAWGCLGLLIVTSLTVPHDLREPTAMAQFCQASLGDPGPASAFLGLSFLVWRMASLEQTRWE